MKDEWVSNPVRRLGGRPMLWKERVVLRQLAWDAMVRRAAVTWLGWPWLIIQPVMSALGITFLFGIVIGVKTGSTPYFLFILVGRAIWNLFSEGLDRATRSLYATRSIRNRIAIPKQVAIVAYMSPALSGLLISFVVVGIATVGYWFFQGVWHVQLNRSSLLVLPAIALAMLLAFGIAQWTAVWGERTKDIRYILGYVLSIWGLVTPVMYPISELPAQLRWTVPLNPAALPVLLGREAFFGNAGISKSIVVGGLVGTGIILLISPLSNLLGAPKIGSGHQKGQRQVPPDDEEDDDYDEGLF